MTVPSSSYVKPLLKFLAGFIIFVVGFSVFYANITKDDPQSQLNENWLDIIVDNTLHWFEYNRYRPDFVNVAYFDQLTASFEGDTTRINFSMNHLDYFAETRFERYLGRDPGNFPYIDLKRWDREDETEYRAKMTKVLGVDPMSLGGEQIGKIHFKIKTWRMSDRVNYYVITMYAGNETNATAYRDMRLGNVSRHEMIEVLEDHMDAMTKFFAKKFFRCRNEWYRIQKHQKI